MDATVGTPASPEGGAGERGARDSLRRGLAELELREIVTAGTGREPDVELRESMSQYGMLEPLDVRAREQGGYELVGGSRRLIAARKLGWTTITALIEPAGAATLPAELKALLLNLHRESLQQIYLAKQAKTALSRLGCSQANLARRLGIGRSTLSQMLSVLACPDLVLGVELEGLEFGAAKRMAVLLPVDRRALMDELRAAAARDGRFPSVRQIEIRVRERLGHAPVPQFQPAGLPDLVAEFEGRRLPIRIRTLPGKRTEMQVVLRLTDATRPVISRNYTR